MIASMVSLFIGSLLASTLLPGGVEVLLYYLQQSGAHNIIALLSVATLGNTLGGIITYIMGRLIRTGLSATRRQQRIEKWFRLNTHSLKRVNKWGVAALFFSWMPIIGDPLCLAAGYLRLNLWSSIAMIFIGKLARYSVLLWLYTQPWSQVPM